MIEQDHPSIHRQVYKLTAEDFARCPVWEFVPEERLQAGEDEATVRACPRDWTAQEQSAQDADSLYVVAADAVLHDSTVLPGYLYTGDPDDPADVQPHLLLANGQVNFWFGSLRFRADPETYVDDCYVLLDKPREAIFPIRFSSRVHVKGAPLRVVVTGFKASDHHDHTITIG